MARRLVVSIGRMLDRVLEIDLRFADSATEAEFKIHLSKELISSTRFMAMLLILGGVLEVVQIYLTEVLRADDPFNPFASFIGDPRAFRFWTIILVLMLFPCLLVACTYLGSNFEALRFLNVEALAVAMVTMPCLALPWSNAWSSAMLYEKNPTTVWTKNVYSSEYSVALSIDALVTILCLFVPVRSCIKWITPCLTCISFATSVFALGSAFPENRAANVFILCSLSVCATMGAWRNEVDAREKWIAQQQVDTKQLELEQQFICLSRMLDLLCDGFVHLSTDLRIVKPCQRLAALLMRAGVDEMIGTSFCELLATDVDRKRFADAVTVSASSAAGNGSKVAKEESCGGVINITLVDESGNTFPACAYHAKINALTGESRFVVGIAEMPRQHHEQRRKLSADSPDESSVLGPGGEVQDLESDVNVAIFDNFLGATWCVEFDFQRMEILQAPRWFTTHFGDYMNQDFSRLLNDAGSFKEFLKNVIEAVLKEKANVNDVFTYGSCAIRPDKHLQRKSFTKTHVLVDVDLDVAFSYFPVDLVGSDVSTEIVREQLHTCSVELQFRVCKVKSVRTTPESNDDTPAITRVLTFEKKPREERRDIHAL
eukprot:TRINITY_DN12245_c0_g1_i1.p1 TRINITY_DN12245_c0_g1~~TRINITY_DN12245_c0_g1_i1.p1  ORF type:complete len:601 (-),score=102.41 TRINITY_DN12245_c0_g1_i1:270-2072(-)